MPQRFHFQVVSVAQLWDLFGTCDDSTTKREREKKLYLPCLDISSFFNCVVLIPFFSSWTFSVTNLWALFQKFWRIKSILWYKEMHFLLRNQIKRVGNPGKQSKYKILPSQKRTFWLKPWREGSILEALLSKINQTLSCLLLEMGGDRS